MVGLFQNESGPNFGSKKMHSKKNQGSMFATWFRLLTLLYITGYLNIENNLVFTKCPVLVSNVKYE